MKTDYLLKNFSKKRFRHYSREKLNSLNNRYMRVIYAVYVLISDFFKIIIPKIFKKIVGIPICILILLLDLLDSIFETLELWFDFIKIAYYWDRLKDKDENTFKEAHNYAKSL